MKILLDQNLSPRLIQALADELPNSAHVRDIGLAQADDGTIWQFAASNGYTIVSKDDDFRERARLFGPPPQVILLKLGNCSTSDIENALRRNRDPISRMDTDPEAALLLITLDATLSLLRHSSESDET